MVFIRCQYYHNFFFKFVSGFVIDIDEYCIKITIIKTSYKIYLFLVYLCNYFSQYIWEFRKLILCLCCYCIYKVYVLLYTIVG